MGLRRFRDHVDRSTDYTQFAQLKAAVSGNHTRNYNKDARAFVGQNGMNTEGTEVNHNNNYNNNPEPTIVTPIQRRRGNFYRLLQDESSEDDDQGSLSDNVVVQRILRASERATPRTEGGTEDPTNTKETTGEPRAKTPSDRTVLAVVTTQSSCHHPRQKQLGLRRRN